MAGLSWALLLLLSALAVAGCTSSYQGVGPYDQGYGGGYYESVPQYSYAAPWVGMNTPWVFYQGDWFYNGMLYNYYGNRYGWAPYYAYPPTYIVRPNNWYAPRWNTWYQQHPQYRQTLIKKYPYWRDHRYGQHYDQNFYNKYHRGQGEGWQKRSHDRAIERPQPQALRSGPGQVTPREGQRSGPAQVAPRPGPAQVNSREGWKPGPGQVPPRPGPGQVSPYTGQRSGPAQVATPKEIRPAPAMTQPAGQGHVPTHQAPPQGVRPGPAQVAPPEKMRPAPAQMSTRQEQRSRPAPAGEQKVAPAGKPRKAGPGEENR